jgi:hypothetical protein
MNKSVENAAKQLIAWKKSCEKCIDYIGKNIIESKKLHECARKAEINTFECIPIFDPYNSSILTIDEMNNKTENNAINQLKKYKKHLEYIETTMEILTNSLHLKKGDTVKTMPCENFEQTILTIESIKFDYTHEDWKITYSDTKFNDTGFSWYRNLSRTFTKI